MLRLAWKQERCNQRFGSWRSGRLTQSPGYPQGNTPTMKYLYLPNLSRCRKAALAAKYPHMPCTPPPGGVEDEQIYSPFTGVAYGTSRSVGRVKSWRRSWTPPLMSPPM